MVFGAACKKSKKLVNTSHVAASISTTAVHTEPTTIESTTVKPTEQPTTEQVTEKPVKQTEPEKPKEELEQEQAEEQAEKKESDGDDSSQKSDSYTYSNGDVDLIARAVYLESGSCGEYCQWLTASTVMNLADRRGGIESVVFDYNTFNVAGMIYDCTPSNLSYSVAQRVVSGDRDYNVMAFRAGYYHDFGTPYTNVDNVYFSTY